MADFDHLVYAVLDLDAAADALEAALGVRPSAGGQHLGRGTRNHLLAFDDGAYLEVLGIDHEQPAPDEPRPFGIDDLERARRVSAPLVTSRLVSSRLVTWAVRVADIDAAIADARTRGYDPGPARAMSRATPDGGLLTWKLTDALVLGDGLVPFLIEWGETIHPSRTATGGAELRSFTGRHPDPGPILDALHALGLLDGDRPQLTVTAGPDAGLAADISGPAGQLTLR